MRLTALAMVFVCGAFLQPASAQMSASPDEILNQLQRNYQGGRSGYPAYAPSPLDVGQSQPGDAQAQKSRSPSASPARPLSTIEKEYSRRVGSTIRQFGYDTLGVAADTTDTLVGGVAENYVLGVGDEIVITLRGQRNTSLRTRVDRDGNVILPDLPPVNAAGRTFGQFREQMEAEARSAFLQTEVFMSLGAVREVGILVSGEVRHPGLQRLSGLSTLVGALVAAGGPRPSGSLRAVQLVRNGQTETIDLYSLLLGGRSQADRTLRDGDRIVVPSIKNTIAVAGEVVRPGIYEITGKSVSQEEALKLAGGPLRPEGNRFLLFGSAPNGAEKVVESSASTRISVGEVLRVARSTEARTQWFRVDGHVALKDIRSLGATPTLRDLLADPQVVKDDAYMLFAVVQTSDPITQSRRFVAFDPSRVRAGQQNYTLHDRDTVIFLSMTDIRYLMSADVQAVLRMEKPYYGLPDVAVEQSPATQLEEEDEAVGNPLSDAQLAAKRRQALLAPLSPADTADPAAATAGEDRKPSTGAKVQMAKAGDATVPATHDVVDSDRLMDTRRALAACSGLRVLSSMVATGNISRFPPMTDMASAVSKDPIANVMPCPEIYDRHAELLPFVLDYVTSLEGEVRRPGVYPVLPGTMVGALVNAGGGNTRQADLKQVEVSRYESVNPSVREILDLSGTQVSVAVGPGDGVRINPLETARELGTVVVSGEVPRPGTYSIRRGERLSELLIRAGGLGEHAYPIGAVFTRQSVRREEQKMYELTARELESSLPSLLSNASTQAEATAGGKMIAALNAAVTSLRNAKASGRVVTEADPILLQLQPEKDTVLQPGDAIFIPKRPSHVTVMGEVLNPGAQQFQSGLSADKYIDHAGGLRESADASRAFLILPSGQAKPLSISSWNFSEVQIPPGSTIVVPRDVSPPVMSYARDIFQIMSQVAISAASLAVISRN